MKTNLFKGLLLLAITGISIVLFSCTGITKETPTMDTVEVFKSQLANIDKTDINSVIKATNLYEKTFIKNGDTEINNKAFKAYYDYYLSAFKYHEEKNNRIYSEAVFEIGGNPRSDIRKKYADKGFDLIMLEGDYYLQENPMYLYKTFAPYTGQMWKDYFYFQILENKHQFMDDAHIFIPWDDMRERIIYWEEFLKKYPDFPKSEMVNKQIKYYLRAYLGGQYAGFTNFIGNEEWDGDEGRLKWDIKHSFEKYIHLHNDSQFHQLVTDYYNLLAKHDFMTPKDQYNRENDYINTFLRQHKLSSEYDDEGKLIQY